jgi:hypothetical protein
MENKFTIQLNPTAEQLARLQALQANFIDICNAIAPIVQETRCWNRVALHHMVYHKMRMQFPLTGSQMVCNAIYSVCRAARVILQHPKSPWNIELNPEANLPKILFLPQSPVFFDRHTLNLKGNRLSMYTLDGRIRFDLSLSVAQQEAFHQEKLKEVLLVNEQGAFSLHFHFGAEEAETNVMDAPIDVPKNIQVVINQMQYNNQPMAMAS